MWAPGIVGVVIGLLLLVAVKDSPEKIGYPPVEIVKPNKVQYMQTMSTPFLPNVGSVMRWAPRCNSWLLIKSTPKGVVFSFLFFSQRC